MLNKYFSIILAGIGSMLLMSNAVADQLIDLQETPPQCGAYKITAKANRQNVIAKCKVEDTHNLRVRLFHGVETLDIKTDNMGLISCQFSRSAINSNGKIRKCWNNKPAPVQEGKV